MRTVICLVALVFAFAGFSDDHAGAPADTGAPAAKEATAEPGKDAPGLGSDKAAAPTETAKKKKEEQKKKK